MKEKQNTNQNIII